MSVLVSSAKKHRRVVENRGDDCVGEIRTIHISISEVCCWVYTYLNHKS